ncbi:nuclear transport factor 2 family protein [Nonomuraea sp. FMUSA5-5]|uniref:Nuclear transport factor 2 family protein n=1 Tax=Nonomuraea composti TaxID=2720023 RepID=A0ABX1BD38_9ACTN|nr:nuclear transport factor 2 family protein [Nonomuraea sp. FMUSA5-5]NJP94475.1 nuclear transport factor 2 family protein [Nonomuraea sp. FMUSA5-5]
MPTTTDDRTDVTELIYRLYACMDEGRFTDLPALFADGISVRTPGGLATGRDAVVAQAARNHSPEERVQHFVHNPLVEVDGDHATIRADVIVTFTPESTPQSTPEPRYTLSERFRYEATRSPEGWRLSRVDGTPVWSTGTSRRAAAPQR